MNADAYTVPVLDHGFVTLRNCAGPTRRPGSIEEWEEHGERLLDFTPRPFDADDVDPANAARMSFGQMDAGRTAEQDHKLAGYLMKNWHTSPFEMIQVWLEMKLPIFVARQLVRHRTVRLNEISGRYVSLPPEWYIPAISDVVLQAKDKKQGGKPVDMADPVQRSIAQLYVDRLQVDCVRSYTHYVTAVEDGIAMEQARCHLHLNHYTHWLWNQDLHNLFHMLSLRDHSHAQGEAQRYAQAIDSLVRRVLPKCFELYDEYRRRP